MAQPAALKRYEPPHTRWADEIPEPMAGSDSADVPQPTSRRRTTHDITPDRRTRPRPSNSLNGAAALVGAPTMPSIFVDCASGRIAAVTDRLCGRSRTLGEIEEFIASGLKSEWERNHSGGCVSAATRGEFGADEFERVGGLVDEAEVAIDDVTVGVLGPSTVDQDVELQRVVRRFGS